MLEMLNPKTYGLNAAEAAIVLAVIGGIGVVAQRHAQVLWRAVKARLFVEVELTSADLADDYLQRWQALHKEHMEDGKRRAVYFALCPPAKAVVSEDTVAASRCVVLNP